jgi:hypothetical protein
MMNDTNNDIELVELWSKKEKDEEIVNENIRPESILKKSALSLRNIRLVFFCLITILFVLSFCISITISRIYINFNHQCPLFGKIRLLNQLVIDFSLSKWSKFNYCQLSMSFGVLLTFYCVFSVFFFAMFNFRDVIESDDCLILPWLGLSVLMSLFGLINAYLLSNGFDVLCNNLSENNRLTCRSFSLTSLSDDLVLSLVSSWCVILILVLICVCLIVRLNIDRKDAQRRIIFKTAINFEQLKKIAHKRIRRPLITMVTETRI